MKAKCTFFRSIWIGWDCSYNWPCYCCYLPDLPLDFPNVTTELCFIFITFVLGWFRVIVIPLFSSSDMPIQTRCSFVGVDAINLKITFFILHFPCIGKFSFCPYLHGSSWFLFGRSMFLLRLLIIWEIFSVQL